MARRPRIDSAAEAVRVMSKIGMEIVPPSQVKLYKIDQPFWQSVVAEFARAEWTEHQLELAAMLARSMADLEREQRRLRKEGFVSANLKGSLVENPRARAVKSLTGEILSLRRSLALHARARSGDSRNDAARRATAKGLEATLDDELLARPLN